MNPFKIVTRPVRHVGEAIVAPFRALFVVGLCWLINAWTSPGHWWVQWVALGMGIYVLVAWARAFKSLLLLGLIAFVGWQIWKRFGPAARARFDEWVARTQPKAAQVIEVWRSPSPAADGQAPFRAH